MTLSETLIVAVPSAADAWTDVGTFTVPANVQRLSGVSLSVSPDWGTTAGSVRNAPVFRAIGSGLQEQSPHEWIGNFGGHAEVTTGGISQNILHKYYSMDVPVSTGGTITVQVNTLTEAVTAGTVIANLFYDNAAPTAQNSMCQYVSVAGTTTADSWTTVGTFTVPKPTGGKEPTRIRKVILAVAPDQGTTAISIRLASRFRLSGSGINEGGAHEYIGATGFSGEIGAAASQGVAHDNLTVEYDVNIPVSAGGTILAEHRFDVETPTASTAVVGLMYA